jgi:hypothetical protein
MEWVDIITRLGAGVAAGLGLWKFITILTNVARDIRETKECVMNNIKNVEDIPDIKQHCKENYLTSLRLTVMCKDMPLGERIAAGTKYLNEGGNGEVKQYLINELHIYDTQKS